MMGRNAVINRCLRVHERGGRADASRRDPVVAAGRSEIRIGGKR
jgi:hypothetical protein